MIRNFNHEKHESAALTKKAKNHSTTKPLRYTKGWRQHQEKQVQTRALSTFPLTE